MTLALIILVSLAVAFTAAVLVRGGRLSGGTAVPLVMLVPLGGWLLQQRSIEPARSPHVFEVLGQYHRLSDTVRVASDAGADYVLRSSNADIRLAFDAATRTVRVGVERAATPVVMGRTVVNGVALARRSTLTAGDASRVVIRPWFCWRCDTRYVEDEDGGGRSEVRVDPAARIAVGGDTITLLRVGGTIYAAADPRANVHVDGAPMPVSAAAAADTLRIGWPDGERVAVVPRLAGHRLDLLVPEAALQGWVLPQEDTPLRLLVAATAGEPLAGTLPVINPAEAAPGAAAQPYGGMLEQHGDGWRWLQHGVTAAFEADVPQLLPRAERSRGAGHIVRLRQYDMHAGSARLAVIIAWLAGALSLGWLWRNLHPEALAPRVALLGPLCTLAAVRATLAFRAWLAPPHDTASPRTLLVLLVALPLLTAALHLWHRAAELPATRRMVLRDAAVVGAISFAALLAVTLLALPAWRVGILGGVAAATLIPCAALAIVNRMLLAGRGTPGPLAAAHLPAQEGYSYRLFISALVLIAVLGFLLLLITQLLRLGTLIAIITWCGIFAATVAVSTGGHVMIRPRSRTRPALTAAAAGAAAGGAAWVFGLGSIAALAALVAGGAAAWFITVRARFRLRPVRLRDLAGPPLLLVVAASLGAVLLPGLLGSGRVVAEYTLAMAGLITVTRIFAILWHRHTRQLAAPRARRDGAQRPALLAIGLVALLAMIAVYLPLTAFDAGLVLLFFAATLAAIFVAFYTMGARAAALLMPAVVAGLFFLGMFVRPASLEDGSAELRTAQIRYAATYHPAALEQHMLTSGSVRPLTTVRTLQQYWGVRHFAAGGVTGRGYFGAAYADWIVPRPVALTENVFSTFLLSEHGWPGGAAVLLCYLAIALALLYGASRAGVRSATAPLVVLLAGIAAFWLVPAFYIAAANGVLVPLTGQNMPMLGLLSSADVVLACWLGALGLAALPLQSESGSEHMRSDGWSRRMRSSVRIVGAGFTATAVVLIVLLLEPVRAETGDFELRGVVAGIESLVAQGALTPARDDGGRDTIVIAQSAAAHPYLAAGGFVRAGVRRANRLARGEVLPGGCLEADPLLRVRSDGEIAVHAALCTLRATAERRQAWTGSLVAASSQHDFVVSDGRTAVVLEADGERDVAIGRGCSRPGTVYARSVRLGCSAEAPLLRFGTSAPVLENAAGVELNGAPASAPTLVRDGDHIRSAAGSDVWAMQLPRGAVTYARWENAGLRRLATTAAVPWIAQLDTQLTRGMAHPERARHDVALTLRPTLHAALQQAVADVCRNTPRARRCSALIADPSSGEILALAASAEQPHRFLPADPNLRSHPAASAIKPILAAAALHAYPQLLTLEVDHAHAEYSTVANTAVQPAMRAARLYPAQRVPLRGYLGASDNLYSATLGFLAASARGADDMPALHGSLDESQLRVNGRPLRGRPSWAAVGRFDLSASPLATALHELFGAHVSSNAAPVYDRDFWSEALRTGALLHSGELQRITPEPVTLDMDAIRSARELAAFTIGGDRNRWSNVALVQAMSRLHSGRGVRLHIVSAVADADVAPPPHAFALAPTPRTAVLEGMDAVTREPWGTGYALRDAFPAHVLWRAKTGTLQEREWVGSVFLFAGGPATPRSASCHAAGVLTIEFAGGANPDGRATAAFRERLAPLLRRELGWGERPCLYGTP